MNKSKKVTKVACIGEVMIELVAHDNNTANLNVAGDTFNTAVYLAQLLDGPQYHVSYVTALGTDRFSDRVLRYIESSGLGIERIERRNDRTVGLYAIDTDPEGERSFTYWRSESAARSLFSEPCQIGLDSLHDFDLVYLSGITLAILPEYVRSTLIRSLAEFRTKGGTVVYDSNYRPALWDSNKAAIDANQKMWANTDIALPSIDDEQQIFSETSEQDTLNRLKCYGLTRGALKRGPRGPVPLGETTRTCEFAPAPLVVDTTAAGDSFNAGFLAAVIQGETEEQAMTKGHQLASKVVQHRGAIVSL